jgi:hypothetical protein
MRAQGPARAVRQRSMARMTLSCGQEVWVPLRSMKRPAQARKMSATSKTGRLTRPPSAPAGAAYVRVSSGFGAARKVRVDKWR